MAPTPGEKNAGESAAGDAPRSLPTPFLTKTFQLVDDVLSWNDDGSTFVVWNPTEFARDLLPKYFKHNNFSSFVRKLNTYGFRKVVPDRWEFSNECFRKGEKRLLCDMQRRKVVMRPASRTGSPFNSGEQVLLYARIRLLQMRYVAGRVSKHNDRACGRERQVKEREHATHQGIEPDEESVQQYLHFDVNYTGNRTESGSQAMNAEADRREVNGRKEDATRLFGVSIGTKRLREDEGDAAEQEIQLQLWL